ncbi:MAG: hypothetical protein HOI59_12800 [Nitrospina sp.]|jgi:hypothetical protein|nr:hypothetical protein [Nitrospina sp.]MBT3415313.1 hypothetical protein [Nitrospina sp.]MBT3855781.1 hypothetical protein [Nitrospina sp.]MBT4105219.1 hypothetical protein [Nitrospina sp.]MBT4390141.1 hypothetical protein [Nitrospina sp.]
MTLQTPVELLIECGGCGLENLIPAFTSEVPAICNQCRENMLAYDLSQTHQGHTCDSCGRAYLLKTETEFVDGESECQCGGRDFTGLDLKNFAGQTPQTAESKDADDNPDFDWCRPASDNSATEDYNEIFDDNPGI